MFQNYNQNMQVDKSGNNFMYMPNYSFTPYQMQQMGQNDAEYAKAYKKWYKDVTTKDDYNEDEDDEGMKKKKKKDSKSNSSSDDSFSDKIKKRKKEKKKAAKKAEGQWKIYAHALLNILYYVYVSFIIYYFLDFEEIRLIKIRKVSDIIKADNYRHLIRQDRLDTEIYYLYGFAFWLIIFLYIAFCSEAAGYLMNIKNKRETVDQIDKIIQEKPICRFYMTCYHYEQRQRTVKYTDDDGNEQYKTEYYQEKVITHTATEEFHYRYWTDRSINIEKMIKYTKCLRLNSIKKLIFFDEKTDRKYQKYYNRFVSNHSRDVHNDHREEMTIPNFQASILCTDKDYWWASYSLWLFLCLCNLNFIVSSYFFTRSRSYKYPVLKMISYKRRIDKDSDDSDSSDD
eukprot:Mrub_04095.p1 GENE.Mrub_04095~~Mrub_04095.p1  ORF type:complete len:433 (+),score=37.68 Mrub_04095:108-1301(+)